MNRFIPVLIAVLLCISCKKETSISVEKGTLISNVTVISANDSGIIQYIGSVVLEGDSIIYADKQNPLIHGKYQTIDGKGKYLISGLMDSHVHLANTAGFNGHLKNKYPELVHSYFEQLPRSYLYHGFTMLVDVNNYWPELINQINNSSLHPDIFTCGKQVQVMDDFNMEMEEYTLEDRLAFPFLYDEYNESISLPDSILLSDHSTKKIISNIKNQNGIGVKIAYEDEASGLRLNWAKPSLGILSDLVIEANKEGMPVLVHAPSLEGHQIAQKAKVNIYAHGLWNWTANFAEEFNYESLGVEHQTVLNQIAEEKRGYQLTYRAITGEEDLVSNRLSSDVNLNNVYPKKYFEVLRSEEGNWGKNKILGRGDYLKKTNPSFYYAMKGNHTSDHEMWLETYDLYKNRLNITAKFLADRNANFILGSDTPAMNMSTNPPGYNGFLEMKHINEAGVSLEAIFLAATFSNAKAFHLDTKYGGVEKGKVANLLLLRSNPLQNINAYDEIDFVIIHGQAIARQELSALHL